MVNINYKNFKSICRMCMSNCDINFNKNSVVLDIFHKLTDVQFETNKELPQQICLKCIDFMNEIHSFSMTCKQTHFVLMECLNDYKKIGIKQESEIIKEKNEQINIKDEITIIGEHKIEFVNVEVDNDWEINEKMAIRGEITIEEHKIEFIKDEVDKDWKINGVFNKVVTERTNDLLPPLLPKIRTENEEDHISELPSVSEMSNIVQIRHYKCDQCEKSFKQSSHLKGHKRVHSGERPYKCDQCEKSFAESGTLTKHKRVHSGERSYQSDQGNLTNHKCVHSGERPYQCDQCEKSYTHSNNLIRHKRVHRGARPYQCDQCDKSFTQSGKLKIHKRVHSGERPYNCDQCEKTFIRSDTLKSHKRLHNHNVN